MNNVAKVISGSSYSIGFKFPEDYDMYRLQNLICKIGSYDSWYITDLDSTDDARILVLKVPGSVTDMFSGRHQLAIQIVDENLGSLILAPTDILFEKTNNFTPLPLKHDGIDLLISLEIKDGQFEVTYSVLKVMRGFSAYDIALEQGFVGTKEEWLLSLRGDILVMIPITAKGNGDVITHDKESNLRILTMFNDDDEGRSYGAFYASESSLTQFTLKNDFTDDKFNGSLLCVKY